MQETKKRRSRTPHEAVNLMADMGIMRTRSDLSVRVWDEVWTEKIRGLGSKNEILGRNTLKLKFLISKNEHTREKMQETKK